MSTSTTAVTFEALGQGEVVTRSDRGAGAHRGAEAQPARFGAVHRDHEDLPAAADKASCRDTTRSAEHPVEGRDCGQVAPRTPRNAYRGTSCSDCASLVPSRVPAHSRCRGGCRNCFQDCGSGRMPEQPRRRRDGAPGNAPDPHRHPSRAADRLPTPVLPARSRCPATSDRPRDSLARSAPRQGGAAQRGLTTRHGGLRGVRSSTHHPPDSRRLHRGVCPKNFERDNRQCWFVRPPFLPSIRAHVPTERRVLDQAVSGRQLREMPPRPPQSAKSPFPYQPHPAWHAKPRLAEPLDCRYRPPKFQRGQSLWRCNARVTKVPIACDVTLQRTLAIADDVCTEACTILCVAARVVETRRWRLHWRWLYRNRQHLNFSECRAVRV